MYDHKTIWIGLAVVLMLVSTVAADWWNPMTWGIFASGDIDTSQDKLKEHNITDKSPKEKEVTQGNKTLLTIKSSTDAVNIKGKEEWGYPLKGEANTSFNGSAGILEGDTIRSGVPLDEYFSNQVLTSSYLSTIWKSQPLIIQVDDPTDNTSKKKVNATFDQRLFKDAGLHFTTLWEDNYDPSINITNVSSYTGINYQNTISNPGLPIIHPLTNDSNLLVYLPFDVNQTLVGPASARRPSEDYGVARVNMTCNNGGSPQCPIYSTSGVYGGSVNFDGSNDAAVLALGNDERFNFNGTANFTVMFWIKNNGMAAQDLIVGKSSQSAGAVGGWEINSWVGNATFFVKYSQTGAQQNFIAPDNTLPGDKWTHVAVVVGSTLGASDNVTIYQNGTNRYTAQHTGFSNNSNPIHFADTYFGYNANFDLDEFKIYNRSLTDQEVRAEYDKTKSQFFEPAISYIPMNVSMLGNATMNITLNSVQPNGSSINVSVLQYDETGNYLNQTLEQVLPAGELQKLQFSVSALTDKANVSIKYIKTTYPATSYGPILIETGKIDTRTSYNNTVPNAGLPLIHARSNESNLLLYLPFDVNETSQARPASDYSLYEWPTRCGTNCPEYNATGQIGGAYGFQNHTAPNQDRRIDILDNGLARMLNGSSAITITAWYNHGTGSAQSESIFGDGSPAGGGQLLREQGTNDFIRGQVKTTDGIFTATSSTGITDNIYNFVAMTYNGTQLVVYQDGVVTQNISATGTLMFNTSSNWSVGKLVLIPAIGSIDELTLWNKSFTIEELGELRNMQTPRFFQPANAYYQSSNESMLGNITVNVTLTSVQPNGSSINVSVFQYNASGDYMNQTLEQVLPAGVSQKLEFSVSPLTAKVNVSIEYMKTEYSATSYGPILIETGGVATAGGSNPTPAPDVNITAVYYNGTRISSGQNISQNYGSVMCYAFEGVSNNNTIQGTFDPRPSTNFSEAMLGCWDMDYNTLDATGRNTLILKNGADFNNSKFKLGNNSLSFNGGTMYANASEHIGLDNLSNMTISAWILPDGTGGGARGRIAYKANGTGPDYGWGFQYRTTGISFVVDYSGTNLEMFSTTIPTSLANWTHVAMTWNGSTSSTGVHIYFNGSEVPAYGTGVDGTGTRLSDNGSSFIIGGETTGTRGFDGNIDQVVIWNRELSSTQISEFYNTYQGYTCSEILAQNKLGIIPTGSGTPFFTTNSSNPWNFTATPGVKFNQTMCINATGLEGQMYESWAFFNVSSNFSASDESIHFNISIIESTAGGGADPCDCPGSGDWVINDGSICTLTSACFIYPNDLLINNGKLRINDGGKLTAGRCLSIPGGLSTVPGGLACSGT